MLPSMKTVGKHQRRLGAGCLRNGCIPYLFFRDEFPVFDFSRVMLPVGFLVEELEKAQFALAFGRFCGSEVLLLLANDYGSKAAHQCR